MRYLLWFCPKDGHVRHGGHISWSCNFKCEVRFQRRLIEAGKRSSGISGLKLCRDQPTVRKLSRIFI